MKHITVKLIMIILGFCLLTSCNHQMNPFHKTLSIEEKACYQSCLVSFQNCQKVCHNNCRNCRRDSECSTLKSYAAYFHEQAITGSVLAREKNAYKDPLQCSKVSCNCYADYTICKQSCSGKISKKLLPKQLCC